jgi:hypothetical protein
VNGLARFDSGHELRRRGFVTENCKGTVNGSTVPLFGFDPASGVGQNLRVDYLSVCLFFASTDLTAGAVLYMRVGGAGIPIPLLNCASGTVGTNAVLAACAQLSQPFVVNEAVEFSLVGGSSGLGTSDSVMSATISASVAWSVE